jgi:hypothetical protein
MGLSQFRGGKKMLGSQPKLANTNAGLEREAAMMGHHLGEHLRSLHGGAFHTHFVRGMNGDTTMTSGPIEGGKGTLMGKILALRKPAPVAPAPVSGGAGTGRTEGQGLSGAGRIVGGVRRDVRRKAHAEEYGESELSYPPAMMGAGENCGDMGMGGYGKAGAGSKRSARAAIVKKVMAEHGMKMIEASKYVKEHGLY